MRVKSHINVRYAETDAQGVVHHANYLIWFELGRSAWLKENGLRYAQWERDGLFVVVAEARVRYRAPALYDQDILLETELLKIRRGYFSFGYKVFNADRELLCEGETRHMVTDRNRNPAMLEEKLYNHLKGLLEDS